MCKLQKTVVPYALMALAVILTANSVGADFPASTYDAPRSASDLPFHVHLGVVNVTWRGEYGIFLLVKDKDGKDIKYYVYAKNPSRDDLSMVKPLGDKNVHPKLAAALSDPKGHFLRWAIDIPVSNGTKKLISVDTKYHSTASAALANHNGGKIYFTLDSCQATGNACKVSFRLDQVDASTGKVQGCLTLEVSDSWNPPAAVAPSTSINPKVPWEIAVSAKAKGSVESIGDIITFSVVLRNTSKDPFAVIYPELIQAHKDVGQAPAGKDWWSIPKCSNDSLHAGDVRRCTFDYEIRQRDIDRGYVEGRAKAQVLSNGKNEEKEGSATVKVTQKPKVTVEKEVLGVRTLDLEEKTIYYERPKVLTEGMQITYRVVLKNVGNQTLTDVTLDDDKMPRDFVCENGGLKPRGISLGPGEDYECEYSYRVRASDVRDGADSFVSNRAYVETAETRGQAKAVYPPDRGSRPAPRPAPPSWAFITIGIFIVLTITYWVLRGGKLYPKEKQPPEKRRVGSKVVPK